MSAISPIFPMPEPPHHFNDYGFDPQMDFFQVIGEARRQKMSRPIDSVHFKLQKPIIDSKRYSAAHNKNKKKSKKKWWKNALTFFKWGRRKTDASCHRSGEASSHRAARGPAISSCPLYLAESRSGSSTPYRSTTGPSSGPLAGTLTPARKGEVELPYLSLRELNMEPMMPYQRMSTQCYQNRTGHRTGEVTGSGPAGPRPAQSGPVAD